MMRQVTMAPNFGVRTGLAVLLTAAADFLLFDRPVGLSLLLFAALLFAGITVANSPHHDRSLLFRCLLIPAGLLPLAENVSALSVSMALISLALFALASARRLRAGLAHRTLQIPAFLLAAPFRFPMDIRRWRRASKRMGRATIRLIGMIGWIMPVSLAAVFVALFGIANPVVEHWLSLLDPWALLELLGFWRTLFWIIAALYIWAFLRPRAPNIRVRSLMTVPPLSRPVAAPDRLHEALFGKKAILRALLVFNLIFAVQTVLDGAYLWGGVALPDGLTYAGYAHRGAYPLIVTALLAACFVLAAMRPGSTIAADRPIRLLVYLWTVQNIVLVASSILRLDLYVGIYSLTYWRVAAFVWMMLVAAGLALIMARIALQKPNSWLMAANLLTLSLTLYACCFVNFAGLIADYNVRHSFEMSGRGQQLDRSYLFALGPEAVPAIDVLLKDAKFGRVADAIWLRRERGSLAARHRERSAEWRAWTFRGWRLSRYLERNPASPFPMDPPPRFDR
ncbi:DUF4173 domain-containing protein [Mesorhizobium sp. IMUNJ 23232]|uniref:DUF4173 domain-containing protein n=1 Tax=Mesorhizobium sp. IMUNJ 23232 TaxID=3376064 RepID=UPI00378AB321